MNPASATLLATLLQAAARMFYMHHPTDRIAYGMVFVIPVMENWLEWEIAWWVHHGGVIQWLIWITTELHIPLLIYCCLILFCLNASQWLTHQAAAYTSGLVCSLVMINILLLLLMMIFICIIFTYANGVIMIIMWMISCYSCSFYYIFIIKNN